MSALISTVKPPLTLFVLILPVLSCTDMMFESVIKLNQIVVCWCSSRVPVTPSSTLKQRVAVVVVVSSVKDRVDTWGVQGPTVRLMLDVLSQGLWLQVLVEVLLYNRLRRVSIWVNGDKRAEASERGVERRAGSQIRPGLLVSFIVASGLMFPVGVCVWVFFFCPH